MSQSIGQLIDQLVATDVQMWSNQETLYGIRRMTYAEFRDRYVDRDDGAVELWRLLQRACDLNVERNRNIDCIDEELVGRL